MSERPFEEGSFEEQVIAGISKLNTKMDLIISDDGETGIVPRLQKDVEKLKKKSWMVAGGVTGLGIAGHWLMDLYKIVKGH